MSVAALLRDAVARGTIAGAVALIARDAAIEVVAEGFQDLATRTPMRRDTIFRIASMTKPITAAATMILLEEGRIALDDPVERWLPELADRRVLRALDGPVEDTVPANRAITLDDLLTFRLGLGIIMAPPGTYPVQALMTELGVQPGPSVPPFGPDEFMARIGRLPLFHQPGERWFYHIGADILTVLIARLTGEPFEDFLRARIFAPTGMRDTGFHVPAENIDRLATCYRMTPDGLAVWDEARGGEYAAPQALPTELVSTADDYLAFARMLLAGGGDIISAGSVRQMMRDHITPEQKAVSPFFPGFWERNGWGYGGSVSTAASAGGPVGLYGWTGGLGTNMSIDPASRRIRILLTQRMMQSADDAALLTEFQKTTA